MLVKRLDIGTREVVARPEEMAARTPTVIRLVADEVWTFQARFVTDEGRRVYGSHARPSRCEAGRSPLGSVTEGRRPTAGESKTTSDHETIRRYAEQRGETPARVRGLAHRPSWASLERSCRLQPPWPARRDRDAAWRPAAVTEEPVKSSDCSASSNQWLHQRVQGNLGAAASSASGES
jgi:hypothetical protein